MYHAALRIPYQEGNSDTLNEIILSLKCRLEKGPDFFLGMGKSEQMHSVIKSFLQHQFQSILSYFKGIHLKALRFDQQQVLIFRILKGIQLSILQSTGCLETGYAVHREIAGQDLRSDSLIQLFYVWQHSEVSSNDFIVSKQGEEIIFPKKRILGIRKVAARDTDEMLIMRSFHQGIRVEETEVFSTRQKRPLPRF